SPTAVVGPVAAGRLGALGREPEFVASVATGAAFGAELPLARGAVLLARSDRALDELPATLRARGALIREVVAYRSRPGADGDVGVARAAVEAGATGVFASPSAVEGLDADLCAELQRDSRGVAAGLTAAD